MKRNILIYLGMLLFFPMGGCNVDDQLFQDVPDSKVLFTRQMISRELFVAPNMITSQFDLMVYRSGVNNDNSLRVEIGVDATLLADHNQSNGTSLVELPAAYYSFPASVTIESGRQMAVTSVTIEAAKIVAELGYNDSYAIPFVLKSSDGATINDERNFVILNMGVREPVILQQTFGLVESSAVGRGSATRTFRVYVEFENEWDIDLKYELDWELIEQYNEANQTSFPALKPENVTGVPGQFTLSKGQKSKDITITISADGLDYFEPMMLPIRLVSMSEFNVAPQREIIYMLFTRQFDQANAEIIPLTADMIEVFTQESSEGPKESLVDGNTGTYWHSAWSDGVEPLPHWIQVNFPQPTTIEGMFYTFRQPSGRTDRPNHWDIQVSDNGSDWTTVWTSKPNLPTEPVDAKQTLIFDQAYTSAYFRLRILGTFGNRNWTHLSTIQVFSVKP